MKYLLALLLIAACGGPTQQQLAETPTARTRATAVEAPPASTADRDRDGLRRTFDDETATQNAYREAQHPAPEGSGAGSGSAAPVKKGPAIEAPKQ
jgi:hypothetical protein